MNTTKFHLVSHSMIWCEGYTSIRFEVSSYLQQSHVMEQQQQHGLMNILRHLRFLCLITYQQVYWQFRIGRQILKWLRRRATNFHLGILYGRAPQARSHPPNGGPHHWAHLLHCPDEAHAWWLTYWWLVNYGGTYMSQPILGTLNMLFSGRYTKYERLH